MTVGLLEVLLARSIVPATAGMIVCARQHMRGRDIAQLDHQAMDGFAE
ncbi:hypothetical protein GCM10008942_07460 [Rhizomicrobium electricum]|uniref:Uncharacterized protein n=1 Tax=Rhizomicrobium electricum TaxID=480070 RepID=A0ABN1E8T6_9PROT